uniref:PseudoU_synth_2 domain-containing protein n=1 Tax=Steinernema glaseri TaxID=37863 RepID=A0A1I7Z366_9BILA
MLLHKADATTGIYYRLLNQEIGRYLPEEPIEYRLSFSDNPIQSSKSHSNTLEDSTKLRPVPHVKKICCFVIIFCSEGNQRRHTTTKERKESAERSASRSVETESGDTC